MMCASCKPNRKCALLNLTGQGDLAEGEGVEAKLTGGSMSNSTEIGRAMLASISSIQYKYYRFILESEIFGYL